MSKPSTVETSAMADAAIHEKWVHTYRTAEQQAFYELAFDEIARRLAAPSGATILDAGCGSCAKSILLAERGFRVVGTDFSSDALALAAETVRARGLSDRITLRQGDLLALPFADGEFRYALCWGVLMHIPDVERALAELSRVLAPGGVLVLSEGNMYSLQEVALRTAKRIIGRRRARVVRRPAGLERIEEMDRGTLLTRHTDMAWLARACARVGLRLRTRMAGQLTELYVLAPGTAAKRAIHALNNFWFRYVGLARPAFGNILIFEKR